MLNISTGLTWCFDYRAPEIARQKEKMLFVSSKDTLRKALIGISSEIQATDRTEIAYKTGMSFLPCESDLSRLSPANTGRKVVEKLAG